MLEILQNEDIVPPGILVEALEKRKISFRVVRTDQGEAFSDAPLPEAIVVLGGTMGACETDRYPFLAAVRHRMIAAVEKQIPLLGICLGGQILADLFGGQVSSNHRGEKGVQALHLLPEGRKDPLFKNVSEEFISFQWHNDSFDPPEDATVLAESEACPFQAFVLGKNAYGLQFHPEVNRDMVSLWSGFGGDKKTQQRHLSAFAAREVEYRRFSFQIFTNFFDLADH